MLDGSISLGPTDGATSLKIGARGDDAGTRFNGLIDEAQVLNRALTPTEILAVVDAGSAGQCKSTPSIGCVPSPAGMVSWWPGDGNADDIQDSTNGVLRNGATFAQGIIEQAFSLDGVGHYDSARGRQHKSVERSQFGRSQLRSKTQTSAETHLTTRQHARSLTLAPARPLQSAVSLAILLTLGRRRAG